MLNELDLEKVLKEVPQLEEKGKLVSRGIHNWVLKGGKPRREAADLLHGTWLGHPLHPVLTDVTIGAWMFGYVLDLISLFSRSSGTARAADTLLNIGNLSAVGTAAAGLTDYSTIPHKAMATGAVHGLLNTLGFVLNLLSARQRKAGNRGTGFFLSSFSTSLMLISAFLGGEMTYKYKVGVNKIPKEPDETKWHPAINDQDLPDRTPKRVEVEGMPILLYRDQGQIYAIGDVCGHDGGPLSEGRVEGHCVTCPWHQSVYDLRDGSVVHGPTTYAEPSFEVRVVQGRIEVRLREKSATEEAMRMANQVT